MRASWTVVALTQNLETWNTPTICSFKELQHRFCNHFSPIRSWLCQHHFGSTNHLSWPPWINRPSTTCDVMVSRHEMTCQDTQALVTWQRPEILTQFKYSSATQHADPFSFLYNKLTKKKKNKTTMLQIRFSKTGWAQGSNIKTMKTNSTLQLGRFQLQFPMVPHVFPYLFELHVSLKTCP